MNSILEQEYFSWLCKKIDSPNRATYHAAMELHKIEFYALLPRDDNRAQDGLTQREYFVRGTKWRIDDLMGTPCTVFEMLVGLAEKMDGIMRETDDTTSRWFWEMLDNLDLAGLTKVARRRKIKRMVARDYASNGDGGLFPLKLPEKDQRKVEIWYQMQAYLSERYPL